LLQKDRPALVLASASVTRLTLLRAAGLRVEARPAHVDEDAIKAAGRADGAAPEDVALLLAELKAARIGARYPDALVIGADQLLVCEGRSFDKPESVAGAREQLLALRGRTHTLVTAVLCWQGGARIWQHVSRPVLTMRRFSEAALEAYLEAEQDSVTASVGAYRLEGPGVQLFDRVEGDHFSVLGLPVLELLGFLRQHGVLAA
jgi:septum formation protein